MIRRTGRDGGDRDDRTPRPASGRSYADGSDGVASGRSVRAGGSVRGQSNVVAIVLLLGMVLLGMSVTVVLGAGVLDDLRTSTLEQDAEQTIREVDSRLTEVALGDNLEHTLAFDASDDQSVRVTDDAEMEIRLDGEESCSFEVPMGSIHYETEGGATHTYQGGGVWRSTASGNEMVSPPDMEYRDGTVTFPSVNVNGSVDGPVEELQASKDLQQSLDRTREYTETMEDCTGASNMTITVTSRYADAWGEYLERRVTENVTYDLGNPDPDDDSVTVTITEGMGAQVGADENEITVDENATVSVSVLGTEVSAESGGYYRSKYWYPVTMGILADGEEVRPWPDGPYDPDAPVTTEQNLNERDTQLQEWTHEFEVEGGTTLTIRATQWGCDGWTSAGNDWHEGRYWSHRDCTGLDGVNVRTDASSGENPENVRVLGDGDEVPVLETGNRQRNAEEILGPRLNGTGHLQLEENQVVFLFELTDADADWDAADDDGDPNYNDAIALLTIEDQEGRETSGNDFRIRLSMNEVVVEPKTG